MNSSHGRLLRHLSLGMLVLALGILSGCNSGSEKFIRGDISDLNDAFLVQEEPGGSYSLMGLDGEIIVKDVVSSSEDFIGSYDGVYGVKGPSGGYTLYKLGEKPQKLTDAVYESVGFAAEGVIPVQQEYGAPLVLSTKDGKPLFEVKEYKGVPISMIGNNFYGGINYYAIVNQTPGAPQQLLYGFINTKGEFLTKPIYETITETTTRDKLLGALPADGESRKVEILNSKGQLLFSTTIGVSNRRVIILLGKDRCVIGDKIFDLKGEVVGRLPGESAVQCIGPRDYILALDGDVWYLLDKDGKEVTTIRNAMTVFFDTAGRNYVVAERLNSNGKFVLTAYTLKGNKSVYEVTGNAFAFLKDGKFLLKQGSDFVMYDAKGKEVQGKYFSRVSVSQAPYGGFRINLEPIRNTL